jgi:hypothetical protein
MDKQLAAITLAVVVVILVSFNEVLSAPAEITEKQDIAGIAQRLKGVVIPSGLEKLIYNAEHDYDGLEDGSELDEVYACHDLGANIRSAKVFAYSRYFTESSDRIWRILLENDDEEVKKVVVARQACKYGPHTYNRWVRGEELYPKSVSDKESEALF